MWLPDICTKYGFWSRRVTALLLEAVPGFCGVRMSRSELARYHFWHGLAIVVFAEFVRAIRMQRVPCQ